MGKRKKRRPRIYKGGLAIFAVDPGNTTGYAHGLIPRTFGGTVKEHLKGGVICSGETKGDPIEQAAQLCVKWLEFLFMATTRHGIATPDCHFVWESFQLRQLNVQLSPLEVRVAAEGMLVKLPTEFETQTASQAKSYATDNRLRAWDQWVRGSAHERDARRHLALKLNVLLSK